MPCSAFRRSAGCVQSPCSVHFSINSGNLAICVSVNVVIIRVSLVITLSHLALDHKGPLLIRLRGPQLHFPQTIAVRRIYIQVSRQIPQNVTTQDGRAILRDVPPVVRRRDEEVFGPGQGIEAARASTHNPDVALWIVRPPHQWPPLSLPALVLHTPGRAHPLLPASHTASRHKATTTAQPSREAASATASLSLSSMPVPPSAAHSHRPGIRARLTPQNSSRRLSGTPDASGDLGRRHTARIRDNRSCRLESAPHTKYSGGVFGPRETSRE